MPVELAELEESKVHVNSGSSARNLTNLFALVTTYARLLNSFTLFCFVGRDRRLEEQSVEPHE